MVVFQRAGQVGVTGAEAGHGLGLEAFAFGGHLGEPVLVVAVDDDQRNWAADGHTAANPGHDQGVIRFDLLASPAAVAALTASQVVAEIIGAQFEPSRNAINDDRQLWAMRFARGQPPKHGTDDLTVRFCKPPKNPRPAKSDVPIRSGLGVVSAAQWRQSPLHWGPTTGTSPRPSRIWLDRRHLVAESSETWAGADLGSDAVTSTAARRSGSN